MICGADLVRDAVAAELEKRGCEVVLAPDGRTALTHYSERPADLVVTDIVLPDANGSMDGFGLIGYLRRSQPNIPIIAIGGGEFGSLCLRIAKALGVKWTVTKPLEYAALLGAVQIALQAVDVI